jgi:general secretion pathway protein D
MTLPHAQSGPSRGLRALPLFAAAAWLAGIASVAAQPPAAPAPTAPDGPHVRATILPGTPPTPPAPPPVRVLQSGDISLNFPGVAVGAVAKSVLGDTLGLPFTVDPSVHATVTVVTPKPIRRDAVLPFLEQALANAKLVLAKRNDVYTIAPAEAARAQAPVVGPADTGYGNETVTLKFVNADQIKKVIDPLAPGAISAVDAAHNTLVVSGTSAQRAALRDLVAQFDVDWLKGMSFGLFVPQRTDARLIAPELEKLLNGPGAPTAGLVRLITMDRLNGMLAITAQAKYLDDVRRFVEVLDREGESAERNMFVYHVQNGRAADLARVLNSAFGFASGPDVSGTEAPDLVDHSAPAPTTLPPTPPRPPVPQAASKTSAPGTGAGGRGDDQNAISITADETNNAIVVFATPRNYARIQSALTKLDVPPLQVLIDATISEVSLNHALQYGLQWSFQSGYNSGALTQGTTSVPVQNFPGFSYLYQGANFQATFNALKTITDVKVLSAPKVIVMNNHTASLEVGDQVPISTGTAVSTISAGAPIVNSIEYRDTGVILKITPRVNAGGLVLLDIAQEVSDVQPLSVAQKTSGIDSPTIQQRKIATSIAVQDGETIAIGGLIRNQVDKGRSTVPVLGDIPVLGHLFGDTTGGLVRTELVVLLTPHVVRTPEDARSITDELREKLREAAPPLAKLEGHVQ